MPEPRYFIPQQVTGSWQLYGLSPRHLVRLLPLPIVLGLGVLMVLLLWGLVPGPGLTRMVLRSLYLLVFPVGMSVAWIGLMVIPTGDAGRTWWDVLVLARAHQRRQTVFLPRRLMAAAPAPKLVQQPAPPKTVVSARPKTSRGKTVVAATPALGRARNQTAPVADLLLWLFLGALVFGMILLTVAVATDYSPVVRSFGRLLWSLTGR